MLNVEETVYGLDRRGMWSYRGETPNAISRPIDTLVARINFAVESKFTAVWHPASRVVRWWVALDAATVFMNQLKAQSRHPQKRIGGVVFNISAAWMPLDGGGTVREAKLIGCRIVERQFTNAPGPDPSIVTFPLDLMDLDVDGTKL